MIASSSFAFRFPSSVLASPDAVAGTPPVGAGGGAAAAVRLSSENVSGFGSESVRVFAALNDEASARFAEIAVFAAVFAAELIGGIAAELAATADDGLFAVG